MEKFKAQNIAAPFWRAEPRLVALLPEIDGTSSRPIQSGIEIPQSKIVCLPNHAPAWPPLHLACRASTQSRVSGNARLDSLRYSVSGLPVIRPSLQTSPPNVLQRLGVKVFGGEKVIADKIIVRQRGTKLHACNNVGTGRDWTLFALKDGTVAYDKAHRCVSIVCPLFWHSKSAGFDAGAPFAPHPAFTCASTGPV